MTNIYNFDAQTGEFTSKEKARLSPRWKSVMVPANATAKKPPAAAEGKIPVWNGESWSVKTDLRGTEYWLADQTRGIVELIGDELPEGAILTAPTDARQEWDGSAWVLDLGVQKSDAVTRIEDEIDMVVTASADNPSQREIASWPDKISAAKSVLAGEKATAQALVPVQLKYGIDARAAAERVYLNARLYALVNAAAETMAQTAYAALSSAQDGETVDAVIAAFLADKDERLTQFAAITTAAKAGDLGPLEAAEAEINSAVGG